MSTEELATLLREKSWQYKHMDNGGWDYEEERSRLHSDESLWDQYVHRSFLKKAAQLLNNLEGQVDLETIRKVVQAL